MTKFMKHYTFPFKKEHKVYRVGQSEKTELKEKLSQLFDKKNYSGIEKMFLDLYNEKKECLNIIKLLEEDIVCCKREIDEFKVLKLIDSKTDLWSNRELLKAENISLRKELNSFHNNEIDKLENLFNKSISCPRCSYLFKNNPLSPCGYYSNNIEKMKTSNGNIMNLPVIMGERKYLNNENIDDDANCGSHNNPNKNIVYVNNFYRRINTNDNAYARKPYDKLSSKSQRRRNVLFTKILLKRNGGQKLHIATLRHIIKEMGHEQSFMPTLSLGELQEYALHHKVSMRSVYKIKQIIEDKLQYKMFPSVSEIKTIWQTSGVVIDESQMEEVYKSVLENCDNYQYEVSEMKTHIDYSQFNDPV